MAPYSVICGADNGSVGKISMTMVTYMNPVLANADTTTPDSEIGILKRDGDLIFPDKYISIANMPLPKAIKGVISMNGGARPSKNATNGDNNANDSAYGQPSDKAVVAMIRLTHVPTKYWDRGAPIKLRKNWPAISNANKIAVSVIRLMVVAERLTF